MTHFFKIAGLLWSACHKKRYLFCVELTNFGIFTKPFPIFFSKQAKLRQPNRAETADFRFRISNFEIRQIAFLMTCRPQKVNEKITRLFWQISCFYAVVSKHVGDFFKFLGPSQKSWTLIQRMTSRFDRNSTFFDFYIFDRQNAAHKTINGEILLYHDVIFWFARWK